MALVAGIAVGYGIRSLVPTQHSMADHWRSVREYRAFVMNPKNAQPDPQTGLSYVTSPEDEPEPHLAALVAAGELEHLNIVLPTVPYANHKATRHWMAFCESHPDDIVWAYGNPSYVAFPTKGEQPLHLQLWFPEESTPVVQQLIAELEEIGEEPTR